MRNRILAVAAVATMLSVIGALAFSTLAHADDITANDLGRSTDTFYYNDSNPAQGELTVTAWGTKYDSDGDDDNVADKHRSRGLAVKKHNVRRIALRSRLQRFINDAAGARWVTVVSSSLINSGTAQSVRADSPIRPFACGDATDTYRYRAVSSGGVRYNNNFFEHFEEISGTWWATGQNCP